MRPTVDQRRPAGVNLRFIRIAAPGGASWLLATAPALGAANGERPAGHGPRREAPRKRHRSGPVSRAWRSAYAEFPLSMGRSTARAEFGVLASSARRGGWGQRAPGAASWLRLLSAALNWTAARRCARALGERRTFSGLRVEWPLPEPGRRRRVALSGRAAVRPRSRISGLPRLWRAGRGAPRPSRRPRPPSARPEADRPPETQGFEPERTLLADALGMEPRARPAAAGPIESDPRSATMMCPSARAARGFPGADGEQSPRRCPKRSSPKEPRLRRTTLQPKKRGRRGADRTRISYTRAGRMRRKPRPA